MIYKLVRWLFGPVETPEEEQIRFGMITKYHGKYE